MTLTKSLGLQLSVWQINQCMTASPLTNTKIKWICSRMKFSDSMWMLGIVSISNCTYYFKLMVCIADKQFEPTSTGPDDYRIVFREKEFRFMLFRHWSLYDSMFHSSYVASKLGIWRERGRQKLQNLLAKMGFSLSEAHQHYIHMHVDLRKDIYERLEDHAVLYGLTDLTYRSFHRHYGFKCIHSAADVVYSLTALLESSTDIAARLGVELSLSGYTLDERASLGSNVYGSKTGFYLAYDALDK
jgi:hypothetical protein